MVSGSVLFAALLAWLGPKQLGQRALDGRRGLPVVIQLLGGVGLTCMGLLCRDSGLGQV